MIVPEMQLLSFKNARWNWPRKSSSVKSMSIIAKRNSLNRRLNATKSRPTFKGAMGKHQNAKRLWVKLWRTIRKKFWLFRSQIAQFLLNTSKPLILCKLKSKFAMKRTSGTTKTTKWWNNRKRTLPNFRLHTQHAKRTQWSTKRMWSISSSTCSSGSKVKLIWRPVWWRGRLRSVIWRL